MIAGGLTVVIWKQLSGGVFELYEIIPGLIASTTAVIIGILLTPPPSNDIVERHDTIVSKLHSRR